MPQAPTRVEYAKRTWPGPDGKPIWLCVGDNGELCTISLFDPSVWPEAEYMDHWRTHHQDDGATN